MSVSLKSYLDRQAATPSSKMAAAIITELAVAAWYVHQAISTGRVDETVETAAGSNPSGEVQKPLDVFADEAFLAAAAVGPVCLYGSEEREEPVVMRSSGLALAIDPLDGSSNIETNIAVGTIFSILPVPPERANSPRAFEQPGANQLAAGFFIYGARLLFVLTLGQGTATFAFNIGTQEFLLLTDSQRVPIETREYAINASNRRHWPTGVRRYIEDTEAGEAGPRGRNYGMRYVGSLVADAYRILQRGGIFLYPDDCRPGYRKGRLRHLYETNPIAFCIEQAGGAATDGRRRMLDIPPGGLHDRRPFVFGSRQEVETVRAYAAADER